MLPFPVQYRIDRESPLLLASGSPRRADLLAQLELPFVVRVPSVVEAMRSDDTPQTFLERVVADKLRAALALPEAMTAPVTLVADTIVVVDGQILGKPRGVAEATEHLQRIAGRSHQVMTRYAFGRPERGVGGERTVVTEVTMRPASPAELGAYAASGEGLDKAGAYALQGLGAFLVTSLHGSASNVIGLPQAELVVDLLASGVLPKFPL